MMFSLECFDSGFVALEIGLVLFIAAGGVGAVPDRRNDSPPDADAHRFDFQQVRDREIDHIGDRGNRGVKSRNVHDGVSHGIVVVDAHVGEIEEIFSGGMTDEVILRHFVLPERTGNGDDDRSAFFRFHCRINRSRIDADVVEDNQQIARLKIVVADDRRAEIHGSFQLQILQRLIEDRERRFPPD